MQRNSVRVFNDKERKRPKDYTEYLGTEVIMRLEPLEASVSDQEPN